MWNLFKLLIIVGLVLWVAKLFTGDATHTKVSTTSLSSVGTNAKSYAPNIAAIPPEVAEYVKTATKYNGLYNENKKFAVYFTGMDCPYGQSFANSINEIANNPTYQQYYNFLPLQAVRMESFTSREDADNNSAFYNLCHEFCIVNPIKNELYAIEGGVGEEEAAKVQTTFEDLKNW